MPLTIKGKRPGLANEERLDRLAALWVDAEENGEDARRLRVRRDKQEVWLNANRHDPRWAKRAMQARIDQAALDRTIDRLHELARAANALVDGMDDEGRAEARRTVHDWAATGSSGVYAITWKMSPTPDALERMRAEAQRRRETVPVPF